VHLYSLQLLDYKKFYDINEFLVRQKQSITRTTRHFMLAKEVSNLSFNNASLSIHSVVYVLSWCLFYSSQTSFPLFKCLQRSFPIL
jgi:hypothetical protein